MRPFHLGLRGILYAMGAQQPRAQSGVHALNDNQLIARQAADPAVQPSAAQ
jgi:hypothetical protein